LSPPITTRVLYGPEVGEMRRISAADFDVRFVHEVTGVNTADITQNAKRHLHMPGAFSLLPF